MGNDISYEAHHSILVWLIGQFQSVIRACMSGQGQMSAIQNSRFALQLATYSLYSKPE